MGAAKKNARRQRAHLIFIDESGLLMAPLVRRTLGDSRAKTRAVPTGQRAGESFVVRGVVVVASEAAVPRTVLPNLGQPVFQQSSYRRVLGDVDA